MCERRPEQHCKRQMSNNLAHNFAQLPIGPFALLQPALIPQQCESLQPYGCLCDPTIGQIASAAACEGAVSQLNAICSQLGIGGGTCNTWAGTESNPDNVYGCYVTGGNTRYNTAGSTSALEEGQARFCMRSMPPSPPPPSPPEYPAVDAIAATTNDPPSTPPSAPPPYTPGSLIYLNVPGAPCSARDCPAGFHPATEAECHLYAQDYADVTS